MLVSCRLQIYLVAPECSWSSTSHEGEVIVVGAQDFKRRPFQIVQLLDWVAAVEPYRA